MVKLLGAIVGLVKLILSLKKLFTFCRDKPVLALLILVLVLFIVSYIIK